MNSYNKKNVKKLYMLFVLVHLTIIFISTFFKDSQDSLYFAIQTTWIINTVIISAIFFWIVIESLLIIQKLKMSFINFKSFKSFKRFTYLNDFFKLILITFPIFISTEIQAVEYFWNSNQALISLEIFLIIFFTVIILFTFIMISTNIIYAKIRNKIKSEINQTIFFSISTIIQQDLISSEYLNFTKLLLKEFKLDFMTITEKNSFVEQVVNWKKSFHLKIFKKGVTPPLIIS
ncbi:hypothetical protein [Spiroplasma cantharicola]|uniref:Transmembrane protein n=1 Tax=Spiroplasma cantharicola TaxID=362837 RepID=A0A0M3SJI9_9MOLU|nr:hypothetical protein [Spiroplasma cantharicola]ALD66814.1 hypothetical protein SCANT_v1c09080 [Spiroplasma cantharicola]